MSMIFKLKYILRWWKVPCYNHAPCKILAFFRLSRSQYLRFHPNSMESEYFVHRMAPFSVNHSIFWILPFGIHFPCNVFSAFFKPFNSTGSSSFEGSPYLSNGIAMNLFKVYDVTIKFIIGAPTSFIFGEGHLIHYWEFVHHLLGKLALPPSASLDISEAVHSDFEEKRSRLLREEYLSVEAWNTPSFSYNCLIYCTTYLLMSVVLGFSIFLDGLERHFKRFQSQNSIHSTCMT